MSGHRQPAAAEPPRAPGAAATPSRPRQVSPGQQPGPRDWTVIAVSTWPSELAQLDALVDRLRQAGIRGMSRSRLIRLAVQQLDEARLIEQLRGQR
jgi:hypothetical protein